MAGLDGLETELGGLEPLASLTLGFDCGSVVLNSTSPIDLMVCHAYHLGMSSTTPSGEDPEVEQITLKLTQTLLERVDDQWRAQGFPNRSEYIRHVLHDAVTTPQLDRDELLAIALGERELRQNPDGAMSSADARELAGEQTDE